MRTSEWPVPQRDAVASVPGVWDHEAGPASGVRPPDGTLRTVSMVSDFCVGVRARVDFLQVLGMGPEASKAQRKADGGATMTF